MTDREKLDKAAAKVARCYEKYTRALNNGEGIEEAEKALLDAEEVAMRLHEELRGKYGTGQ